MVSEKMRKYTPNEYQKIMLEAGSVKDFAKYLNIDRQEADDLMYKYEVRVPTDYVRTLKLDTLIDRVIILGSFAKLAQELGVSRSFLVERMRTLRNPSQLYEKKPTFTKQGFIDELERVGSIKLMAKFYNTTDSFIRKCAEKFGLTTHDLVDMTMTEYNTGKGARAEEYLKTNRSSITRDLNKELGSKAPYDLEDLYVGRINVKASRSYPFKSKGKKGSKFWKFSTSGVNNADVFALVFYDAKFVNVLGVMFVTAESIKAQGKNTLVIDESSRNLMDINSIHLVTL